MSQVHNVSLVSSEEGVNIILLNDFLVAPSGSYICTCFLGEASSIHVKLFQTYRGKFEKGLKEILGKNTPQSLKLTDYSQAHAYF